MSAAKKKGLALKIILPLLILAIGIIGLKSLSGLKQAPKRQQPPQLGVLVDVVALQPRTHQVKVHATGTVTAEQEISLVPEVSGKVTWISPQLVAGGLFRQGETLLKIDSRDYQLAVERARAEIARAEVALRTEQEKARVAVQEWQQIELPDKGTPGPLVTREIQLQQERANLTAARANLQQAELNLQRTEIKAPFNGRIRQEQVDLGQYLRAGSSIGSFAGTDRAEIRVPLPLDELRWLRIPTGGSDDGSLAVVKLPEDSNSQWQGRILRSLGEVDLNSRMATLVIGIDDPYQRNRKQQSPVLQNGRFVEIEIFGKQLGPVFSIPREALRSGQQIWIADTNNRLRLRPVQLLRREQQQVLLAAEGIAAGEKLVLTSISGAADGLRLRPVLREQDQ